MEKINELRDKIESIKYFIEIAEAKRDKIYTILTIKTIKYHETGTINQKELTELFAEYCRISNLIDEAKVDIEDIELQIERLEKNDTASSIKNCYVFITY